MIIIIMKKKIINKKRGHIPIVIGRHTNNDDEIRGWQSWSHASLMLHHPPVIFFHLIVCLSHALSYFFSDNHDSITNQILFFYFLYS